MALDIIITLTAIGADQGTLFKLYSDVDGFDIPYESDVPYASLISGYTTSAPDNTETVRVYGQTTDCTNYVDISPVYTTTTTTSLPPIECDETVGSGGVGVTEYSIPLDPSGGILVLDVEAYGITDKVEIIHNNIKKATTGMTVANSGPFDYLYGDPTVPTKAQTLVVDQFIGTAKSIPPNREADIFADTGFIFTSSKDQLVWWEFNSLDTDADPNALIRITGPTDTAWTFQRLCIPGTTTTTTTAPEFTTTTTTTTATPTTTTTTTLAGLLLAIISTTSHLTNGCNEVIDGTCYVNPGVPVQVGDIIYSDVGGTTPFVGTGDYYKLEDIFSGSIFISARISAFGEVLSPIILC